MNTRPPSMFDVAREAGVSHQTVSRVLNNHPNVSEKTKVKVEAAMEKMGYRPNLAARMLVTGRSSTIGVLSYDTTLFGPASMLHSVQVSAREVGYAVHVVSLKAIDSESIKLGLLELVNAGVAGVVIIAPQAIGENPFKDLPKKIPGVVVESDESLAMPSVQINQKLGAQLAVRHLVKLGHKKIAHISGPLDWYESKERLEGWSQELKTNKLNYKEVHTGDWSARAGYEETKKIIATGKATAIFAGNDSMALGALKALREAGISVPEEMSLIGFDDMPESAYLDPGLTTVAQDFDQVGTRSLELLVKLINREKLPSRRVAIEPGLIVRQSTCNAPK